MMRNCAGRCEGDIIGPYTLRQEIGEGGFGTVWMAEQQDELSRMVALKVVKAGKRSRIHNPLALNRRWSG